MQPSVLTDTLYFVSEWRKSSGFEVFFLFAIADEEKCSTVDIFCWEVILEILLN